MDISKIAIGKNAPEDINVIIEVPMGSSPVKYEFDKDSSAIFVDRFLSTAMFYPANYGFIPHTLSGDGDPCDVLVLSHLPVIPGCVIRSRPIGVLMMEDEAGIDEKILAVPHTKLYPLYHNIKNYSDVAEITLQQIAHFFEHYKDLESGKWVKVTGWENAEKAGDIIMQSIVKG